MPARVLIIDPDEDQLTTLRSALQQAGYSVEVARDGLEGFEKFKQSLPWFIDVDNMKRNIWDQVPIDVLNKSFCWIVTETEMRLKQ